MRRASFLAAFAVCLLLLGAPAAQADLASLKAACGQPQHPTDDQAVSYVFCDDGVPPFGGRTANPTGQQAIKVPAAYRWPAGTPGVQDPTVDGLPPKDPAGATTVGGADANGDIALDVDVTMPTTPPPPGGYPLMVLMHGCCSGNKTSWESNTLGDSGEKWHYNSAWFASRGYVVLTYTARGFVDGSGHGSTGETQIDSLQYEINDYQYLAGLLADDHFFRINPKRVVATGGSYGGGFAWLALTDPIWQSPGGKAMKLAAVGPRYGWTDLPYSLLPTGNHFFDFGSPPATDGSDSGVTPPGASHVAAGIPIQSIIAALFISGATGIPPGSNHATFPQSVTDAFNCTQSIYPPEDNPACASTMNSLLQDFLRYRSAYERNGFFANAASNPSFRIPIFSAGTHTDPLFPPIEHHRMAARLRSLVPGYPIQEYFGDYQHFTQNKAKEWGDICGSDHHVCQVSDYPGGNLNATPNGLVRTGITTRLNRFFDFYTEPSGDPSQPQPSFDVTASLQVCANAAEGQIPDEPGATFTAPTYKQLTSSTLSFSTSGGSLSGGIQTTTSTVSPNPHAAHADPVANTASNGSKCVIETTPAGAGVATYDSPSLGATANMIGGGIVTVSYSATTADGLELNARLYDVFPDGSAVLVDRGPKRLTQSAGTAQFQLHGNGWQFLPGHKIRLELAQDDTPYLKASDVPSSATITGVKLDLPVR